MKNSLLIVLLLISGIIYSQTESESAEETICEFTIPNAFTPNGDEVHDTFQPLYNCTLQSFSLIIYNRWGEAIYETDELEEYWDGKIDGTEAASGAYVYMITYTDPNGEEKEARGVVTLLR